MRVRLLPATLGLGGLLLVSKSLALALAYLPGGWALGDAVVPVAIAASAEGNHAEATTHGTAAPPRAAAATPAAPAKPPPPSEPSVAPVSDQERQLLQDLRARRQQLEAKERTLAERESVLSAAEGRLVTRASELAALQVRLEQMEKARSQREETNWLGLVKVYEAMKPREAAAIFNDMDMPVLLEVVDRMKEAKTALILAAMLPDRARLVTAQLAAKRSRATTVPDPAPTEGNPRP